MGSRRAEASRQHAGLGEQNARGPLFASAIASFQRTCVGYGFWEREHSARCARFAAANPSRMADTLPASPKWYSSNT